MLYFLRITWVRMRRTHVLKEHVLEERERERINNKFIWVAMMIMMMGMNGESVWMHVMLPFYFSSIILCNVMHFCATSKVVVSSQTYTHLYIMNITNQFDSFKNILFTYYQIFLLIVWWWWWYMQCMVVFGLAGAYMLWSYDNSLILGHKKLYV